MKKNLSCIDTPQAVKNLVFDTLLEDFPIAFYWTDVNGVLLGCNKTELKILGLSSPEEFVGKYLSHFSTREAWQNSKKILKENKAQAYEEVHIDENGKKTYYFSVKKPLQDATGKTIGLLGVAIDISDRKRAEEYRLKHESAEKVVKFTNLVAGSIAHELKTPLTIINQQMDLLELSLNSKKQTQQEKDSFLRQSISMIKSVVTSTIHIVNDILIKIRAFATGQLPQSSFEEISIVSDIKDLLKSFPFVNNEQNLVKVFDDNGFNYVGDRVLTHHILTNLLKNALYAIREAGKGEITIELKVGGDFNQLIFRDTALGIPEEFVDKIFDQFATKKIVGEGTGLGLAFCKMVMEYYNGDIICKSEKGKYTEFVLSFPKLQAQKTH